jgi:hypothetical protein
VLDTKPLEVIAPDQLPEYVKWSAPVVPLARLVWWKPAALVAELPDSSSLW